mmetsp:Transcript_38874/g.79503  ORF Transcript_38874/g.79503 Transcript_38874/m.79503 type:complete len:254 (+) Transcript_38874:82-843(+)
MAGGSTLPVKHELGNAHACLSPSAKRRANERSRRGRATCASAARKRRVARSRTVDTATWLVTGMEPSGIASSAGTTRARNDFWVSMAPSAATPAFTCTNTDGSNTTRPPAATVSRYSDHSAKPVGTAVTRMPPTFANEAFDTSRVRPPYTLSTAATRASPPCSSFTGSAWRWAVAESSTNACSLHVTTGAVVSWWAATISDTSDLDATEPARMNSTRSEEASSTAVFMNAATSVPSEPTMWCDAKPLSAASKP